MKTDIKVDASDSGTGSTFGHYGISNHPSQNLNRLSLTQSNARAYELQNICTDSGRQRPGLRSSIK
ncbi:hypothetical protein E2562_019435 [Oryza meyeriana var. granulata]|uniref:Uncharacterized protein n=1 Tax=Oryza meyeriana var. granulata TaxID=110450 RepID=A0A6G1DK53_9ORYZ|nr:hypothetical protein E2562_019435 [Oryza meyeriana var. granulata]